MANNTLFQFRLPTKPNQTNPPTPQPRGIGFAHGSIDISNASAPFVILLALFNDLESGGAGLIEQEPSLPWYWSVSATLF